MSEKIETQILIQAPAEEVWNTLTAFKSYPEWNPFVKSLEGEVREGNTIRVRISPPGGKGMTFRPVVLKLIRNTEFRWRGHLLFPGIFDGEHYFKLEDQGNGTTTFIHGELFSGFLVPLFRKQLSTNTLMGFEQMNAKLKQVVEGKRIQ